MVKNGAQMHQLSNLKKESREKRNAANLTIDSKSNHINNVVLSKSIDSNTHEDSMIHSIDVDRR